MRLAGARTLLTGASGGIGAALADRLAAVGAELVVSGRDAAALSRVAARTGARSRPADLADPGQLAALAEAAGPIDLLVANAGVGYRGRFATMPAATLTDLVAVDLLAPLLLSRLLLPGMLARGRGHLVLVASIAGRTGVREEAGYAAAKAGLLGFADSLRPELRGSGVGLTAVVPGAVDTPFFGRRGLAYHRRWPRPVPAARVAEATVAAVAADRAEVVVPGWLAIAPRVKGAAPGLFRALADRFG